jgi:dTDP-4-dehydrorhamnose reductase
VKVLVAVAHGPRHLAVAARNVGGRLVQVSTNFVFDGASFTPYKRDAITNPPNVYGVTKRDGENAVLAVDPAHSVIIRTAWVYSAAGHNFVRTMQANGSVRVVADQIGTPTPARRPYYSVLGKTSLISLGIVPAHWRKRLRSVLGELKNA